MGRIVGTVRHISPIIYMSSYHTRVGFDNLVVLILRVHVHVVS